MNNILDKFSSIKITNEVGITPEDRAYCEAFQKAYENALDMYKRMLVIYSQGLNEQKVILTEACNGASETFEILHTDLKIGVLEVCHRMFITKIVEYFAKTYTINLHNDGIIRSLMPLYPHDEKSPEYEERMSLYNSEIQNNVMSYKTILDKIIKLLGGFSFSEKAESELKENCFKATKRVCYKESERRAKRNGSTITLSDDACYYGYGGFEPNYDTKTIIKGISYFFTKTHSLSPELNDLLENKVKDSVKKITSVPGLDYIKFYKNGRVDISFNDISEAITFSKDYLRLET